MRQITAYESDDGTLHHTELAARIADQVCALNRAEEDREEAAQFKLPLDNETLAASFSSVNQEGVK